MVSNGVKEFRLLIFSCSLVALEEFLLSQLILALISLWIVSFVRAAPIDT
jgi:hypothetical protein